MHTEHHNPGMIPMLAGAMGAPLTMSSREIADACGKKHLHVMRDIKAMLKQIGKADEGYIQNWIHPQNGQEYEEYHLPEDLVVTLITGYRADLRYKVVKELEALHNEKRNGGFSLPGSYEEALAGLLTQVRQNTALAMENRQKDAVIAEIQPKADEYDAYLATEGVVSVSDFCNKHQVKIRHPGYVLRKRQYLHQKKMLATLVGTRSGVVKNIVDKENFEYVDSKGNAVEAQSAMIVKQREGDLLRMLIDDHGAMAFRNDLAFARAKRMIGLEGAA